MYRHRFVYIFYAINDLWDEHADEENYLLMPEMASTIRHKWPARARFCFNCYRHWSILVVQGKNGDVFVPHSKNGFTQGNPVAMIAYGIRLLPLIEALGEQHKDVD
jgi:hypothetical protein